MQFGQLWVAVNLTLRSTEEGGRETAIVADREGSYRPNWSVGVLDPRAQTGAPVFAINPTSVSPGGSASAVLVPLHPPEWAGATASGRLFMYEGTRECGDAEIVEIWTTDNPQDERLRARARSWVAGH